ncbi:MAG TPA: hypothetical protein VE090_04870 [Methylomirabilota bacterium]|nr:hypothetical protein [Methylomirabilota bacterium]
MYKVLLWDSLFGGILFFLSLFLISFYFHAETLDTHYADWVVHAFRVKSLETYGLASWTQEWSNGISLWRSYQFLPHFLTVIVQKITYSSVTRAMILTTIFLFVGLRLSLYILLRLLKFAPLTAFICSILSYDIAQYWGGVADYSLMFGFVFFPMMLFFWVKYYQGSLQYLFPYLVGISFYMHPVLGYSVVALWIMGILFSDRKILSWSHVLQCIIFLISSSLFWFPLAFKTSYEYTSPVFANKYFLNLVLSGYKYFGLSLFLLIALLLSSINIFFPIDKKFKWIKVLSLFVIAYFILILLGLNVDLPEAIAQLQFTRAVTIVGLGIIFIFAGVLEKAIQIRSTAFKGLLLVFLCLVVIEGLWFSSIYSPNPYKKIPEAITAFQEKNPQKNISDGRVWSSTIGESSYYPSLTTRLPYSYMGHLESNQISPRISPLILYAPYPDKIPLANITRLNDYFKISGVKYIFLDNQSPFTNTLLSSDKQIYNDLGQVKQDDAVYHAFEVPWQVRNAVAINQKYQKDFAPFPTNLELTEVNDQIALDDYVKKFVGILYQPENIPLAIAYPSYDTVLIKVPTELTTKLLYINESYDAGWKGYFHNQRIILQAAGPNFTKIILPTLNQTGEIILKHDWPLSFYISVYLIFLIPVELLIITLSKKLLFQKHNVYL